MKADLSEAFLGVSDKRLDIVPRWPLWQQYSPRTKALTTVHPVQSRTNTHFPPPLINCWFQPLAASCFPGFALLWPATLASTVIFSLIDGLREFALQWPHVKSDPGRRGRRPGTGMFAVSGRPGSCGITSHSRGAILRSWFARVLLFGQHEESRRSKALASNALLSFHFLPPSLCSRPPAACCQNPVFADEGYHSRRCRGRPFHRQSLRTRFWPESRVQPPSHAR